jgi:hypothetical protein
MTRTLPILCLAALAAACAVQPAAPLTAEETVSRLALERWNHLIAGRTEAAWELLSPGAREIMERDAYVTGMRTRPVRWLAAEVVEVACEEEVCSVDVMVSTEAPLPFAGQVPGQSVVSERWIRTEGRWYFVPSSFR